MHPQELVWVILQWRLEPKWEAPGPRIGMCPKAPPEVTAASCTCGLSLPTHWGHLLPPSQGCAEKENELHLGRHCWGGTSHLSILLAFQPARRLVFQG